MLTMIGLDTVRSRLATMPLRVSPLGAEINAFARWFEDGASSDRLEAVRIRVDDDGATIHGDAGLLPVGRWRRLWRFLIGLGVRELELDARLESNQVADVLTLLYAERRTLRNRRPTRETHPTTLLRSTEGIALACTVTRLDAGRLTVSYSYCMTRFSRLVKWFKERQTHLRDHRSLFRAAPRYAVLVGLGPMAMFLLYALHESWSLLLVTSLLGSVLMSSATYLFFMTVGSVEYDNEEQAHTLKQAYGQLKLYADRISSDMDRARVVQQRLLPDLGTMPLPDRLEWAASFVPQEEVGGDYFDASLTKDGRLAVIFADVSGHGLGAALVTAIMKTIFEAWLERRGELVDLVRLLNQRLFSLTPDQSFAAVAVGIFDPELHSFTYCNCGHNPYPYLISANPGAPSPLDAAQTLILGAFPEVDPRPATIDLQRGDTLIFATDGVTEALDDHGDEFGREKLEQYLADHREMSLPKLVNDLVDTVESFSRGCEQSDDRTVLALRVRCVDYERLREAPSASPIK